MFDSSVHGVNFHPSATGGAAARTSGAPDRCVTPKNGARHHYFDFGFWLVRGASARFHGVSDQLPD
jgi:hypothetical protein